MANRYWVGGSGNWTDTAKWSSSSGGSGGSSVPTLADNVFIDAASSGGTFTITVPAGNDANMINFDATGLNDFCTISMTSGDRFFVHGTYVGNANIYFTGGSGVGAPFFYEQSVNNATKNITWNGTQINTTVKFNENTPRNTRWVFQDAFTSALGIEVVGGGLDTNGQTVDIYSFSNDFGGFSNFWSGSSIITLTTWTCASSGVTLSGASGTWRFTTNSTATFNGGGKTYGTLDHPSGSGTLTVNGANTFTTISLGPNTTTKFANSTTQTLTNFTTNGTSGNVSTVSSVTNGTQFTLSKASGTVTATHINIRDSNVTGGATWQRGTGFVNTGNNTGWITTEKYWVGGGGSWTDTSHWSVTSGGTGGEAVPTSTDAVYFDGNSFSGNATVTMPTATTMNAKSIDWTGVTENIVWEFASTTAVLNIYGSLTTVATVDVEDGSSFGVINFLAPGTLIGTSVDGWRIDINVNMTNGTDVLQLGSAFVSSFGNFIITRGTLTTNNHNFTPGNFSATHASNQIVINLGSSNVYSTGSNGTPWNISDTASSITLNAGTSTIYANATGTRTYEFGGKTYNNVLFSAGTVITIRDDNTFNDFQVTTASTDLIFENGSTQTINGAFSTAGVNGNETVFTSETNATKFYLVNNSTDNTGTYLNVKDSTVSGTGYWLKGTGFIDSGNNTGWVTITSTDVTKSAEYDVRLRMSALYDQFSGSVLNSSLWDTVNASMIAVNDELRITTTTAANYGVIYSLDRYDLTGLSAKVHLKQAPVLTYPSAEATFDLSLDANNRLQFIWYIGAGVARLLARRRVGGVNTDVASINFDPATMSHLRIREASGVIYWDYSGNGSSWTNLGSWTTSFSVTSLAVELNAGQWQAEAGGSTVIFDDLNIDLSQSDLTKSAQYTVTTDNTLTKTAAYSTILLTDDITKTAEYAIPPSEILNSTNLKTLKIGKAYGPITSVVLGRVPQNDNVVIASRQPEANIITSIDTSTNLFTVTGHSMEDGNLVRLESTGTLPAPLLPDTNYYAFTNGSADTFALTYGYEDALTGDHVIDLTTSGSGTIQLSHIQTQEVQINNNQIMDDDRQDLLPNIYKELVGLEWNEVKAETVGLGWHEVGDVVIFQQGDVSVYGFIDEIHLTFEGSIKETLDSSIPDVATINYQTAGGILKTVYNTEIKVDKQENDITSIVSQQDIYATEVQENFTQVYQDIDSIDLTIQKSGGGNLILNSVGFATVPADDASLVRYDKLSFWDYNVGYDTATDGTVSSYSSSESQNAGGTSGQVIQMIGSDVLIKQRINVAANTELSFGVRVNNAIGAGDATITLSNDNDTFTINIDDSISYEWEELLLQNFVSSQSFLDLEIQVSSSTGLELTDMRLLYGTTVQGWVQSPSEILSANVQFTTLGMRILDNVHDTITQVTYNEFSTRRKSDDFVLFEADDSGVVANDVTIKGVTNYNNGTDTVIRQVTIPESSALAGIAFIKVV